MISKFEIKSHDGPGRIGNINNIINTPNILNSENLKIAPSEGSAYNIDKEIAIWNVKKTIENAEKFANECDIAVIQGSKYIDLRCECAEKLEELGYNGFIIANGDELLLHPKDLAELIVRLRETLKPYSYLIFSFSEPSFIPLLTYMGVDGFLDDSAEYYAYNNSLLTATKTYDLNKYKIYEFEDKSEIIEYNKNTLDLVIREVKEHMKNSSLRNLVEERSTTSPQNISTLKILDKNHSDYLLKYNQLY